MKQEIGHLKSMSYTALDIKFGLYINCRINNECISVNLNLSNGDTGDWKRLYDLFA